MVITEEVVKKVLEMKRLGWSYREIGKEIGIGCGTVSRIINNQITKIKKFKRCPKCGAKIKTRTCLKCGLLELMKRQPKRQKELEGKTTEIKLELKPKEKERYLEVRRRREKRENEES